MYLVGEPIGVKEMGGVLEHGPREIEIRCLPRDIPEKIDIDVKTLKIHDSVHIRDISAHYPDFEFLDDPAMTLAIVVPPRVETEAVPVAEAAAEPEVIGKGKEEEKEKDEKEEEREDEGRGSRGGGSEGRETGEGREAREDKGSKGSKGPEPSRLDRGTLRLECLRISLLWVSVIRGRGTRLRATTSGSASSVPLCGGAFRALVEGAPGPATSRRSRTDRSRCFSSNLART